MKKNGGNEQAKVDERIRGGAGYGDRLKLQDNQRDKTGKQCKKSHCYEDNEERRREQKTGAAGRPTPSYRFARLTAGGERSETWEGSCSRHSQVLVFVKVLCRRRSKTSVKKEVYRKRGRFEGHKEQGV